MKQASTMMGQRSSHHDPSERERVIDLAEPMVWKKHQSYALDVDEDQDDKAKEVLLCSFQRPHMR